jgi:5-methylcytosine-specific restriction enzyme subunit McrC
MRVISAIEHERLFPERFEKPSDFLALKNFALTEEGQRFLIPYASSVRTRNWVGIIPFSKHATLEILPKIHDDSSHIIQSRGILYSMLQKIGYIKRWSHTGSGYQALAEHNIYELFFKLYLNEIKLLVHKSLRRGYIPREDNSPFLKGKLNIAAQLGKNNARKDQFAVRYDEYLPDIPENRILKACLLHVYTATSQKNTTGRQARDLLVYFEMVGRLSHIHTEYRKIIYTRMNDYYQIALEWSVAILTNHIGVPGQGKSTLPSLAFPMEQVFEWYVTQLLRNQRPEWKVTAQSSKYYLARSAQVEVSAGIQEVKTLFQLRPDIVCIKNNQVIIADAKWKLLFQDNPDGKAGISQADLYQLLSYATIYRTKGFEDVRVELYYPKHRGFTHTIEFSFEDEYKTPVSIVALDIENQSYKIGSTDAENILNL